jgi:hypothetical protein
VTGKTELSETSPAVPLTEITALVGGARAGFAEDDEDEDDDEDELEDELACRLAGCDTCCVCVALVVGPDEVIGRGPCELKGSLASKSVKVRSCPWPSGGVTAETRRSAPLDDPVELEPAGVLAEGAEVGGVEDDAGGVEDEAGGVDAVEGALAPADVVEAATASGAAEP